MTIKNKLEQRVAKLEQELKEVKAELGKRKYAGLKVGDTFEMVGKKWKILDLNENGVFCRCMESLGDKKFDSSFNDWTSSDLRGYLNTEVYKKICEEIGEENVIEFERNLLSLDGQTEYGACKDKVSLISVDEYRKYRGLIPNFEEWWWTLTPFSTKRNDDAEWITVVSPVGHILNWRCNGLSGVYPVLCLKSNIFVSLKGVNK